jgi:hypothetical protein
MSYLLIRAARSGNLAQVQERIAAGDNIEYRDKGTGRTALLEGVIGGYTEIVTWLLNKGADLSASCKAVTCDSLAWAALEGHAGLVQLLLEKGADPNRIPEKSFYGRSPLMGAAQGGYLAIVKILLRAGANPGFQDNAGQSALALARGARKNEVVDFLMTIEGADPAPPQAPPIIPWPSVTWEDSHPLHELQEPIPIPAEALPAQIVRGFILAMCHWETQAWQAERQAKSKGEPVEQIEAVVARSRKIVDAYCTGRKRVYQNLSYSSVPTYPSGLMMLAEKYPKPSRCEIITRNFDAKPNDWNAREILFVVFRKQEIWRIDSAMDRMIGAKEWSRMIL